MDESDTASPDRRLILMARTVVVLFRDFEIVARVTRHHDPVNIVF